MFLFEVYLVRFSYVMNVYHFGCVFFLTYSFPPELLKPVL